MTDLLYLYKETRQETLEFCSHLHPEDYNLQGAEFTSPAKWHLAHTTWFFEEMILKSNIKNYKLFDASYAFLFNSYYNNLGDRLLRKDRGMISRPNVSLVLEYRAYVDRHMSALLDKDPKEELFELIYLGIQHEQQHQELLKSDLKYSFSKNPTYPVYDTTSNYVNTENSEEGWLDIDEGLYQIGYKEKGFCYDNEMNKHKVYLEKYKISQSLVTNGDFIEFIESGGYENFNFWLDEGWSWIKDAGIKSPLYWSRNNKKWMSFTLSGMKPIDKNQIICHISYYEAMAYAIWKGCRLPTEFEWEAAADRIQWGSRWEWTNSAYLPYPGFKIAEGAVGEYNGKFMANQIVLRGASTATTKGHSRKTYRNFFHPDARWQFTGIRLAK